MVQNTSFWKYYLFAGLFPTPVINACHMVSVTCCRYNLPMLAAIKTIYNGNTLSHQRTLRNFTIGLATDYAKEAGRYVGKIPILYYLQPYLERRIEGQHAPRLLVSFSLACWEVAMLPLERIRTLKQSGQKVASHTIRYFYAGAAADSLRKPLTWVAFTESEALCNKILHHCSSIDPNTPLGIALKTYPQALLITLFLYPLQRVETAFQYSTLGKNSYATIIREIVRTQGLKGLWRGAIARSIGTSLATFIHNTILSAGRNNLQN